MSINDRCLIVIVDQPFTEIVRVGNTHTLAEQLSEHDLARVNSKDRISNALRHGCLLSFSEKYGGSFRDLLLNVIGRADVDDNAKDNYILQQIMSATVQIIFALSEMHKLNLSHSDSHEQNIFIKRLEGNVPFTYDYEDDGEYKLTLEDNPMLYILADFGMTGDKIIDGNAVNLSPEINRNLDRHGQTFLDRLLNAQCDLDTMYAMNGANYRRWKRSALYDLYRFMIGLIKYGLNRDQSIRYPYMVMFTSTILIFLYNKIKSLEFYPMLQASYDPLTFFNDIPSLLHKDMKTLWDRHYATRTKKCDSCDVYNVLTIDKCSGCGKNLCKGGICGKLYKRFFGLRPKKKKSTKKTKKSNKKSTMKTTKTKTKKSVKKSKKSKRSIRHKK